MCKPTPIKIFQRLPVFATPRPYKLPSGTPIYLQAGDNIIWIEVLPFDASTRTGVRVQPAVLRRSLIDASLMVTRQHLEEFGNLESTAFGRVTSGMQRGRCQIRAKVRLFGNDPGTEQRTKDKDKRVWAVASRAFLFDSAAARLDMPIPVVGPMLFAENGWTVDQLCE
jgi:hypothetical protein